MQGRNLYLLAFALAVAAISYFHVKTCKSLPFPGRFVRTGMVYVILYITSLANEEIAGVTAIGFTLAIYVGLFTPNSKLHSTFAGCEQNTTGQPTTYGASLTGYTQGNQGFFTEQPPSYGAFASSMPTASQPGQATQAQTI